MQRVPSHGFLFVRSVAEQPNERPDACDAIQDPIFSAALQSGALHPNALRHQQALTHLNLAESPTSVVPAAAPAEHPHQYQSPRIKGVRPASAPPEMSKQPLHARPRVELDDLRNLR